MKKRRLSILLSIVMLLSLLPTTALAADTYPTATAVSVDGNKSFSEGHYYFKNGDHVGNFSGEADNYNAYYNPNTGVLTLQNYNGGSITVGGNKESKITVVLVGDNFINDGNLNSPYGGDITVTSGSSGGTLSITQTIDDSNNAAIGIKAGYGNYETGNVTIMGDANVTINMTHNGTSTCERAYGIYAKKNITISDNASVYITCATPENTTGGDHCNGLRADENVIIDTTGTININVTNAGKDENNGYSYGVYPMGTATLTKVGNMEVQWKKAGNNINSSGGAFFRSASFSDTPYAINVDETNCYASYRHGTPRTVTVENGTLTGPGVPNASGSGSFLQGDKVNITPDTKKSWDDQEIPFKEWTSSDVTLDESATTASNSFTVPVKDVTVTAKHSPFVGTPTFTPTDSTGAEGTLTFTTKVKADETYEGFRLVKEAEVDDPTKYKSINPSTTSPSSPYEYSYKTSRLSGVNKVDEGNYYVVAYLNNHYYLGEKVTVNYTAAPTATVDITAGTGMALTSGTANQTGLTGAMTEVVYTADTGYYFPTSYSVASVNGVDVTRIDFTQIKVSGTPTANTTITLAPATAKTKEATPSAAFTAESENGGKLTGVDSTMKYSVDGGSYWLDITGGNMAITNVTTSNGVKVKKPASDPNTKLDSDIQTIDITKAAKPTGVTGNNCTTAANNDGKLQNVDSTMEYKKSEASGWTTVSGTEVAGLTNGTYYVRIKASGKTLASDNQTVEIAAYGVPVLTGTVNIFGNEKFGEMLTASVSGDNSDSDNFTYTWKRGSTVIGSGTTYTLVAADISQVITCEVTADDCTGTIRKTTGTIAKADGPAAPVGLTGVAPTTSGGADGKIQNTDATMEWSKTTDFATKTDCAATETTVGVAGTYYVRVKETSTHNAGAYATVNVPAYTGGVGGGGGGGGGAAPTTPAQKPEIKPVTGGKVNLSTDGTTATITPDAGKVVDKVLVNGKDMGAVTELKGLKTGDKIEVLFKDEVKEPSKAETDKQVKAHMQKLAPKARSLKTKAGNVKVSFEGQFKDIEALGYTVKYKFYRSTKKSSGYKHMLTTSKPSYTNTYGKKGTLYYYKARVMIYDKEGNLVAQTALKQCKYASRLWTK